MSAAVSGARLGATLSLLVLVLGAAGCGLLFPQPPTPDLAPPGDGGSVDGGGPARIEGQVCTLATLGDLRSCTPAGAGRVLRISVEETREQSETDLSGRFF